MMAMQRGVASLAARMSGVSFGDLSEPQPEDTKTPIERAPRSALTDLQRQWRDDGVVVLRNFLPADLRQAYCEERARMLPRKRSKRDNFWGGWHHAYPYMDSPALRDLALHRPLTEVLRNVMGAEVGIHLALTGWVSTERNFHQDNYLNPAELWSHYVAAWMALDDVHPDSGPFQFVRGSHTWEVLRKHKVLSYLTPEEQNNPAWPSFTQDWVSQACKAEIARRGAKVEEFVPNAGDVLVWHTNLIHRGSQPRNAKLLRKSLICHYSSIHRRPDFGDCLVQHDNGSHYWAFPPVAPAAPGPVEMSLSRVSSVLSKIFKG